MIAFGKFKSNERLRLVMIAFGKLKRDKHKNQISTRNPPPYEAERITFS